MIIAEASSMVQDPYSHRQRVIFAFQVWSEMERDKSCTCSDHDQLRIDGRFCDRELAWRHYVALRDMQLDDSSSKIKLN